MNRLDTIKQHQEQLKRCKHCPEMIGPVVTGEPVISPVMLIGQAPGDKEGPAGKPFAWTAGKTLFKWFDSIGLSEEQFRHRVYMTAVCRCFPGKKPRGGDRVPTHEEIEKCAQWMRVEFDLLQPKLIIPVGKLAITQFMEVNRLNDIIGHCHKLEINGSVTDTIPLSHPSGASTWHHTEPGKTLLQDALELIADHPAWRSLL